MSRTKKKKLPQVEIGVFGGSGFYELLKEAKEYNIITPFGKPSDKIIVGEYQNRKIVFLPRHGRKHHLPPHKIPYKANLWALKELGVTRIISPCAAGSLQANIKPGDFVISNHFVDRTKLRDDTFYHGPIVAHFSMSEPYCPELRQLAIKICQKLKISCHKTGTVVVIEGPRFSTKPESRWFSAQGWDLVNMTQYPEVILANELDMCFVNVALVTDWDIGLEDNPKIKPVTHQEVLKVFTQNIDNVKKVIFEMIKEIPRTRKCECGEASKTAIISVH